MAIREANATSRQAYPSEIVTKMKFRVDALLEKSSMNDPIPWLSAILRMGAA